MSSLPDPVGCGATRHRDDDTGFGCACMGLWDCANDNKLERAMGALGEWAPGMPEDRRREVALAVMREVFRVDLERYYRLDGWEERVAALGGQT